MQRESFRGFCHRKCLTMKKNRAVRRWLCLLMFFFAAAHFRALAQMPVDTSKEPLRVGVAGSPPFVMDSVTGGGISVEIWHSLAAQAGWRYHATYYPTVPAAIRALVKGDLDVVVGPVSITAERARLVGFTQPYYYSGTSILSSADDVSLWQRVRPFFSEKFFWAVCAFLLILAGVGSLLWLAERKRNPEQFPADMPKGVANGMWCAIVTMSTTGYGDKAPLTFWGRLIAASWMVISIIFATTMVAGIASTLTLTGMGTGAINKVTQLSGKRVVVVKGSPAADFLLRYGARETYARDLDSAYRLLKSRQADAVFFDRPQLLYFVQQNPDDDVSVSIADYMRGGYGFALPLGSPLLHPINVALLEMKAAGTVDQIVDGWLGNRER